MKRESKIIVHRGEFQPVSIVGYDDTYSIWIYLKINYLDKYGLDAFDAYEKELKVK